VDYFILHIFNRPVIRSNIYDTHLLILNPLVFYKNLFFKHIARAECMDDKEITLGMMY